MADQYKPEEHALTAQVITRRRFVEIMEEAQETNQPINIVFNAQGHVSNPRQLIEVKQQSLLFRALDTNKRSRLTFKPYEKYYLLVHGDDVDSPDLPMYGVAVQLPDSDTLNIVYAVGNAVMRVE